jgi:hypothetical protein
MEKKKKKRERHEFQKNAEVSDATFRRVKLRRFCSKAPAYAGVVSL